MSKIQQTKGETNALPFFVCVYVSYLNMLILFDSTSLIINLEFPIEFQQTNKNDEYIILITKMWFFSRCISIDSLNTCFQQQKNRTSYDFRLYTTKSDVLAKR